MASRMPQFAVVSAEVSRALTHRRQGRTIMRGSPHGSCLVRHYWDTNSDPETYPLISWLRAEPTDS